MNLTEKAKQMTAHLLTLRRLQDKSEEDFIASLGGLTLPQIKILNIIGDSEPCTMGEIAKKTSLSLSSITLIVDKLVKQKLITRLRSDEDRRIVYAKLAPEGKRIYQVQIERYNLVGHMLLSTLNEQEQDMFINILKKMTGL